MYSDRIAPLSCGIGRRHSDLIVGHWAWMGRRGVHKPTEPLHRLAHTQASPSRSSPQAPQRTSLPTPDLRNLPPQLSRGGTSSDLTHKIASSNLHGNARTRSPHAPPWPQGHRHGLKDCMGCPCSKVKPQLTALGAATFGPLCASRNLLWESAREAAAVIRGVGKYAPRPRDCLALQALLVYSTKRCREGKKNPEKAPGCAQKRA